MATFHSGGTAINLRNANVGAILSTATSVERTDTNWSLVKEVGAEVDSINSFIGTGIVYDGGGLPVAGNFSTWIFDDYLPGGGVEGWVADGFTAAAHPLVMALQANDAKMLFGLILNGNDSIVGTENSDLLDGYRGDDQILGQDGNDRMFGNLGADRLFGGDGDDTLSGGLGKDRLSGDAGSDKFQFDAKLGAANADRVKDFDPSADVIQLAAKVFGLPKGDLAADAFVIGPAAADAGDRIVYDDATGRLSFDADGSGSGSGLQLFAILTPGLALSADDFRIV